MTADSPNAPRSVPELVVRAARDYPERGVVIYDGRGRRPERRRFGEVLAAARVAAGRLAALGVEPGDRVAVCLPTCWPWLEVWLGALLRGALPVAIAPGALLGSNEEHLLRLQEVLELLGGRHLVCRPRLERDARERATFGPEVTLATPESLAELPAGDGGSAAGDPEATAFLQLTSGTTGVSRAVKIPHRAALHNAHAIGQAVIRPLGVRTDAPEHAVVSWLPLYHDMGLVGCFLAGLFHGVEVVLLPSEAFLGRPRLWLENLARFGSTASAAPNFGFQFCVDQIGDEEVATLDLSGVKAAMVGAETVRPETLDAFAEKFAGHGFDPVAFRPCYGLAEATLAVTMDLAGRGPRTRAAPSGSGLAQRPVVSLGGPVADTRVVVTAPDGTPLGDDRIGEIRVRGPGLFAGYWGDEAATAAALEDGWLRTGDLGFVHDGELYVTGRLKDVLIVRGHNVMPEELERLAERATGGGGLYRAGAFSITRGGEGEEIVIVAEVAARGADELRRLGDAVRSRVGQTLALPVADVALVPGGKLPKTTSGKVRRERLRRDYLADRLPRLDGS